MPEGPRHARQKAPVTRLWAPVVAAATLAGVAAAFVFLQGGSGTPRPVNDAIPVTSAGSGVTSIQMTTAVHRAAAALEGRAIRRLARHKHLAAIAAARLERQRAARQQAQQAAPPPSPTPAPTPAPAPSSAGGDAAHSALGVCIRNAEEGGSYAWGPGNGGGAYQFQLGTWEAYGGAASEYGVAGPAYQDQIFNNAIAAGGASNWTNYDGC
jgi:hypothetical protein